MTWAAVGTAAATIGGSYIAGNAAKSAAKTSAAAQERAGLAATSASAFRPVGVTTRFGTSKFTMGTDKYGTPIVTGAEYEASPEIQALQDRLSALYGQNLGLAEMAQPTATSLFNLGGQYLSESPEAARQRIFNQLQEARLPSQLREEQRLASSVFGRGRAGLNVSGTGQPELFALAAAREQQRAADIAAAEQQAQQQISFGTGLMGTGLGLPTKALGGFQTAFATGTELEKAAMQPLELGAQLGGRNVNTQGASALLQAGLGAAQTRYGAQLSNIAGMQSAGGKLLDTFMNQIYQPPTYSSTNAMYGPSGEYLGQGFQGNIPVMSDVSTWSYD